MDNSNCTETEIKQEQGARGTVIDSWEVREIDIKQEQNYVDFIDNKVDVMYVDQENSSHCRNLVIHNNQEDPLCVKQETYEIHHEDIYFKQEYENFNETKEEIDIEFSMQREDAYYKCNKCDFHSELFCSYQVHIDGCQKMLEPLLKDSGKRHTAERKIRYVCEQCDNTFSHKQNLQRHAKAMHDTTSHKCGQCLKTFKHIENLGRHVRIIHNGISYECEQCHKIFGQKVHLNEHVKAIHDGIKYECDQCHKMFSYKGSLNKHVKVVHRKVRYECEQCNKTFSRRENLKVHTEITHEGIIHKCKRCDKTFIHKKYLDTHVKTIHDGIMHECKVCCKKFAQKKYLNKHVKADHNRI